MRSSFCLAAINPPPLMPQDITRTAMVNLDKLAQHVASKPIDMKLNDTDGRMILRQIMDGWGVFNVLLGDYWNVLQAQGLDSRAIDTYGTLMAAAQLLVGKQGLASVGLNLDDFKTVGEIIAAATQMQREQELENWHKCLNWLMQSSVDNFSRGERKSVGMIVDEYRRDGGHDTELRNVQKQLYTVNISLVKKPKFGPGLFLAIPKDGPNLSKIYADQVWYGTGWWNALQQAPRDVVFRGYGNDQKVKNRRRCADVFAGQYG
ncbi:MAG: hypothetical protein U5K75_00320 [Ahrensia sp.]|nr:hypothetical protein [Ahrensia sp.]